MSIDYLSYQTRQPLYVQSEYQINTSKAVKGSKLTMKGWIKKLQIKIRKPSPRKFISQEEELQFLIPKFTEYYEKYKGLESIDDEESLHKFIVYQRQKHSRQSARGIKLFNCQKSINQSYLQDFIDDNLKTITNRNNKTATPHRKRQSFSQKNRNTISYSVQNSKSLLRKQQKSKISYISQNLGKRMNEYLNLVIQKKQKESIDIKQNQIAEELELDKVRLQLQNQQKIVYNTNKMKNNNYFRQMKKHIKSKGQNSKNNEVMQESILIRTLARKTTNSFNFNSNRTTQKSWRSQNRKTISHELKRDKQIPKNNDLMVTTLQCVSSRNYNQQKYGFQTYSSLKAKR